MRWFKHMTNARRDSFLRDLQFKFGNDGYAAWWKTLEFLAENMKESNKFRPMVKAAPRTFSEECDLPPDRLEHIYQFASRALKMRFRRTKSEWVVEVPKLLEFKDEYSVKVSGHAPAKIGTKSRREPEPEPEPESDKEQSHTKREKGSVGVAWEIPRNGQNGEAKKIIGLFEDADTRSRVLEFIGVVENAAGADAVRVELAARELWNLRQTLVNEGDGFPAERIFRYALDQAIMHGAKTPGYVATVIRNAVMKVREGVELK